MGVSIRLLKLLLKYPKLTVVAVGTSLAVAGLNLLVPIVTGRIIDTILVSPEAVRANYELLLILAFSLVGITGLTGLLNFVQRYAGEYLGQRIVLDVRNSIYSALQEKSFSFYDKTQTGELMSRATGDVDMIRMFLTFGFRMLVGTVFGIAGAVAIMLSMNTSLTLIALSIFPVTLLIGGRMARLIRPVTMSTRQILGRMNTILQEDIVGTKVVRVFTREDYEIERFNRVNREYTDANLASTRISATYRPMMVLVLSVGTALIYLYGGGGIISGSFSIGSLVAFELLLARLTQPMQMLGMIISFMQNALVGAERAFEIVDAKPEVQDSPNAIELSTVRGEVKFEDVSFAYSEGKEVLSSVNLAVAPDETVALVGGTGSGKSTLIKLVPRFYDATKGRITIDGHDVRDVKLKSLRSQIGIVMQEIFLFASTIKENIAYGRPNATVEEIVQAAKMAQAHDFIMAFPDGYETLVGERGVTLSGGQKQRLTIARALLADPKILIFDDSTSSVDVETEHEIQVAMKNLLKNRTTFIITQRLSTIKNADRIVVLESGRVIEEGTHDVLMSQKGVYAKIYLTQYATQEPILVVEGNRGGVT